MAYQEKWGFDLTNFGSADTFKMLLRKHKLLKYKRISQKYDGRVSYNYQWSNPKLKIITNNNPLTGIYSSPKQREPEKGYASYIGIEGDEDKVRALVIDIKNKAEWIKGESPRDREFI